MPLVRDEESLSEQELRIVVRTDRRHMPGHKFWRARRKDCSLTPIIDESHSSAYETLHDMSILNTDPIFVQIIVHRRSI